MITAALIDHHPIIRTGLNIFLKSNFEEISIVESDSIQILRELHPAAIPDLIILGIGYTSDSINLKLITHAKNHYPESKIIVYDENAQSSIILLYLRAGASGYLTKSDDINDLVDCIHDVLDGKRYLGNAVFDLILDKTSVEKKSSNEISSLLTSREQEIARYLSDGMKTSMIAQKLDRKASTISTIKNHIFRKLKVDNILMLRDVFQSLA